MHEKLRSLKTSDPAFWAELCNDMASNLNVPKEGEIVVEDACENLEIDDESIGDDSAIEVLGNI